jgi:hypothetical protein
MRPASRISGRAISSKSIVPGAAEGYYGVRQNSVARIRRCLSAKRTNWRSAPSSRQHSCRGWALAHETRCSTYMAGCGVEAAVREGGQ